MNERPNDFLLLEIRETRYFLFNDDTYGEAVKKT